MKSVRLFVPLAAIAGALAIAAPASADPCEIVASPGAGEGLALFDPLGYYFDTDSVNTTPTVGDLTDYATLDDAGSNSPSDTPAGPVSSSDAYDDWGNLFVGGVDAAHQYTSADPEGCTESADSRQLRFASVTLDGLQVQRTLQVPAADGSGVRIADSLTNPTAASITTSVYVGDLTTVEEGDLGSDSDTAVFAASNGTTTMTPASRWAVTTDQDTSGSDPAIAHTWSGPGDQVERPTIAQQGGPAVDDPTQTASEDQVGWAWQNVTIPAGQTATFLSYEILRATASEASADQGAAAVAAAQDLQSAGPARIFDGLDAAEIASVRNWQHPTATTSISAPSSTLTGQNVTLTAGGDLSGGLTRCAGGTYLWDFGDGATAVGASVTHQFATTGTAAVTLTATSDCGATATASASITIAAPAPPVATPPVVTPPTATPKPPTLRIEFVKNHRVLINTLKTRGLRLRVVSSQTGTATVSASRLGAKAKTAPVTGGTRRLVILRPSKAALKTLRAGQHLNVKMTVAGPSGTMTRTLQITVRPPS